MRNQQNLKPKGYTLYSSKTKYKRISTKKLQNPKQIQPLPAVKEGKQSSIRLSEEEFRENNPNFLDEQRQ